MVKKMLGVSATHFWEFFKVDLIFLLFGLQICPVTKFEKIINWVFFIFNVLNLFSSVSIILYSFSMNHYSPRSWMLLTQIICNIITQAHVLRRRKDLRKFVEEVLLNVPKKSKPGLQRLSLILFLLFLLITLLDLAKVFGLWLAYGSIAFINNFFEVVLVLDGMNFYVTSTLIAKLFIDSSIAVGWFLANLILYIYLYWSLKYLNIALLGYINKVLTNEKAEDITNVVYAFRKVYDLKKRFNSCMNLIPFIWYAESFININMIMYDAFVQQDQDEAMCLAFNIFPVLVHAICLVLFTITVVILFNSDRDSVEKIIRLVCLESSRREDIAKLQAFLKEVEIFPTIQPDALSTFSITSSLLVKFILILVNNLIFWFIVTSYGRSIIGMKTGVEASNSIA